MNTDAFKSKLPALFLLGGLAQAILLPMVHLLMRHVASNKEVADKSVFIALLICTGGLLLYASMGAKKIEKALNTATEFWAGQLLLLFLLMSVEILWPQRDLEHWVHWTGYGQKIAILGLILVPVLMKLFYQTNAKLDYGLSVVTYGLVLIFYLPSVIQPPWGVIEWNHSQYLLNEILAPQNGRYPLVNFTSQYTSFFGYVFNLLFRSHGTIDQAVWFLTSLAVITIVIALAPVMRAFPQGKRYLALLFTVPAIFIVKANEDFYSGSIGTSLTALPVRLIFPSIIALLLTSNFFRSRKIASSILLGFICAAGILNNFESGIVSAVAALVVIFLLNRHQTCFYRVALFSTSVIVFFVLAQLSLQLAYGGINLNALTGILGGFAHGHGEKPMQTFGLWIFAFVSLSLCVIVPALWLHSNEQKHRHIEASDPRRAVVVALFWGLFGIGMAPYYINRSVNAGQLQYILFALFLASAGLFLLIARLYERAELKNWVLIIAMLPGAISTASLIQHPSFHLAMERLKRTENPISEKYTLQIIEMKNTISQIREEYGAKELGLFTNFGSLFAGPLSIPSYVPVNHPDDLFVVKDPQTEEICASLEKDNNHFLISTIMLSRKADRILQGCGYVAVNELNANSPIVLQVYGKKEFLSQTYGLGVMKK